MAKGCGERKFGDVFVERGPLKSGGDEYWQRGKSGFTALARLKERVGKNILVSIAAILKFDQQQGSQLCRGTRMGIERILHFKNKWNVVVREYSLPRSRFYLVL